MPELVPSPQPYGAIPLDTSEAPRPRVSGNAIAGSYGTLARGEEALGQGAEELAKPIAEAQAASDLQNQKVTLGPDGKIQVLNPARSVIFGPAGARYGDTVAAGTAAQIGTLVNEKAANIHAAHLGDPEGFKTAYDSFLAGLKGATGNPVVDQAVQQHAAGIGAQHYDSNVEYTGRVNLKNSEIDLKAQKESAAETMETLAKAGKTDDPDYAKAKQQWDDAEAALQANPLLKTPPALADLERGQLDERLKSAGNLAGMDAAFKEGGMPALRKMADDIKNDAKLSRSDRARLYDDVRAYMADRQPEYAANVSVSQGTVDAILNQHTSTSDPAVYDALAKARTAGDVKGAQALMAYLYTNVAVEQWNRLSDADKKTYLDEAKREGLSTEIPETFRRTPPTPAAEPTGEIPSALEGGGAGGGAAVTTPPKAEWPTGAVSVSRTSSGYPVYVDKDGQALPDEKQPKETVAAGGGTATVQPAAVTTGTSEGAAVKHGAFVGTLVQAESGGQNIYSRTDPDVAGPNTRSQGFFQINTPTWQDFAAKAGVDTKKYPNAMSAPYEVQAQVASVIPITRFGPRTRAILHGQFGQFDDHTTVGELDARYGGSSAAPKGGGGAASGGYRPTPAESAANPFLLNRYIASQAQAPDNQWKFIEATAAALKTTADYGVVPSPRDVGLIVGYAQQHPENERAQNLAQEVGGAAMAAAAQGMPAAEHAQWVSDKNEEAANPTADSLQKLLATEALKQDAHLQELWNKDRFGMATRSGWIDRKPIPLDFSTAQGVASAAQAMFERGQAANIISKRKGGAEVSALEPDALANVKAALNGPDADAKAAVLLGLDSLNKLGGQAAGATLRDLRSQPGIAVAMKLMGQGQGPAAQAVLQGEHLLSQEPRFAPKENETGGIEDTLIASLPSSDFRSPDERAALGHAVRDVYATMAAAANDTTQRMNTGRFNKALETVTGGVIDFRGAKVFAPGYGKSADDLDRTLKALTDGDFANARAPDGSHVPASVLQGGSGSAAGRWFLGPGWQLESRTLGSGQYYVRNGDSYLTDASKPGQKFVLDLSQKVDQAPPAGHVKYSWE